MKKKWIIIIGIVGILLTSGVVACHRGCHPGGFDEFDLAAATNRIASRLDLSDSQKAQLERIAGEIMAKAKALHADRDSHCQQLADLIRQDTIDKEEVDGMIDQKMAQMREMADFALERLIVFHGTLTPEQREKIASRIEEHASDGCRFGFR